MPTKVKYMRFEGGMGMAYSPIPILGKRLTCLNPRVRYALLCQHRLEPCSVVNFMEGTWICWSAETLKGWVKQTESVMEQPRHHTTSVPAVTAKP